MKVVTPRLAGADARLTRTDIVHYMISATKELSELLGIPLEEIGIHE